MRFLIAFATLVLGCCAGDDEPELDAAPRCEERCGDGTWTCDAGPVCECVGPLLPDGLKCEP